MRPWRRRGFGACLLGIVSLLVIPGFSRVQEKGKLNVLLVTIDTLRPDRLSCYSRVHLNTPVIDKLAARSVLFSHAFAHTPLTLPSHSNILLGTTPLDHGIHDNGIFVVRPNSLTLARYLREAGYSTGAAVGAFSLDSRFGLDQGFDFYDDKYGSKVALGAAFIERKAERVIDVALDWLKQQTNPWFLWIHLFDPHQPYEPPEPFLSQYKDRLYDGEVAYVDRSLEKLFAYLEETKLQDETLLVLTADHGQGLGEHGESTHGVLAYNSTLWVPLIIYYPGVKPGRVDQNVFHIDIFPTICELLALEIPSRLQGRSLLPALQGKSLPQRPVYFESLFPYYRRGWAPLQGYIDGERKYIESPIPELYDLKKDFHETANLAKSERLDKDRMVLADVIKAWSTGTPGPAPKADMATMEKLKSLGYAGGLQPPKKTFGPEDDLKTLLVFQEKLDRSMELYRNGKKDDSVALAKEVIAERPDFDTAYSFLAAIYKKDGKLEEALELLRKGYEAYPTNYKIATSYGMALIDANRSDEALDVLTKALSLIDYDPELWNYIGVAYWRKKDLPKAIEAYQKSLALDPGYAVALSNLGSAHLAAFMEEGGRRNLQNSMDSFKKAIEADPQYTSAYNGLGSAYRQAGDADAAIFCWKKAIEIEPLFGNALYNLGVTYLEKGEKQKARGFLEKYKQAYYETLSPREKARLDELLEKSV
jgi:arylsulfatase A-like enzyme/Flp pilus assembly protein TadD